MTVASVHGHIHRRNCRHSSCAKIAFTILATTKAVVPATFLRDSDFSCFGGFIALVLVGNVDQERLAKSSRLTIDPRIVASRRRAR